MTQELFQPWQSTEWLTAVLQASNTIHAGTKVVEATGSLLTGGLMADTLRLSLQYSNASGEEPSSIVGKFPASNPDSRAAGHEMSSYFKEINFYVNIAQQLPMRTPHCYHASIDTATSDFALLLEDLAPAFVADSGMENAKDLLLLSLSELALLHGNTRGKKDFKDYATQRQMTNQQMAMAANAGWDILKRVADERLPKASIVAGDKLLENIDNLYRFKELRSSLVHGDYRFPNILYRGNDEAFTVDWQTYDWSNPGVDLSHAIICSLNLEQARSWREECLSHYYKELVATGIHDYSIDDCYYDFKIGTLFDMHMMMVTTFGVGANHLSEASRNQILTACEKVWALTDDLNALDVF